MKLNLRALLLAGAILWGGVLLIMSVANSVCSGYGGAFISLMASVYPGYHGTASVVDVIVGTLYAAFILALFESFVSWGLGATWVMPSWFLVFFGVLAFRPSGLMGTWG